MDPVLAWVTRWGYPGIFALLALGIIGLPVPDETLLTFIGYLIYRQHLQPVPAVIAVLCGTICGITVSYLLGRLTGYFLIEKYGPRLHIHMEHVEKVHGWFRRLGRFALTLGYFIPGVRHLTAYVAGASELEAPIFAVFAYAGAVLWCGTFLTLGYLLGDQWDRASAKIHEWVLWAAFALAAAALASFLYHRYRRREKRPS